MTTAFRMALTMLVRHLIGLALALFMMAILQFLPLPVIGVISILVYAAVIYGGGWNVGKKEARPLPGFHPDVPKAVLAALIAWIPSLIIFGFYGLSYSFGSESVISIAVIILGVWLMPGIGIVMGMWVDHGFTLFPSAPQYFVPMVQHSFPLNSVFFYSGGTLDSFVFPIVLAFALLLLILPVFTVLGYRIGMTGFSITEKVMPVITYKKKKDGKK